MNKNTKGIIYIVFSSLFYGLLPIFIKLSYKGGITPSTLLSIRFLIATIILFLYVYFSKIKFEMNFKHLIELFVLGGIFYAGIALCETYAFKVLPNSTAIVILIMYLYPVFVKLYNVFTGKEKNELKSWIFVLISLIGLGLFAGVSFSKLNPIGLLLSFGAAISYTLYVIYGNKIISQADSIVTSAFVSGGNFITLTAFGFIISDLKFDFSKYVLLIITVMAIFSTVLAVILFFKGMEILGTTKSCVLAMLEPLFAVVFVGIIFKEYLEINQIIGGILLISGVIGVVLTGKKEEMTVTVNLKE